MEAALRALPGKEPLQHRSVILVRRIARTTWSMYTYKTAFDPTRLAKALREP
jgi:hypothetical protein